MTKSKQLSIEVRTQIEILVATLLVEGNQKVSFLIATTLQCRWERYSFPWITLDTYLVLLSIKEGGIKYHF